MFRMDGRSNKSHGGMPGRMPSNLHGSNPTSLSGQPMSSHGGIINKAYDHEETMELVSHIQDMLNQLLNRGVNTMLVTVSPVGEVGIHGSQKGQAFLKDNPDIADRFSKMCSDDVWTLIGAQKRFLDLGRGQNKSNFNEKSEFPLDFSHERGSFFQGNESRNAQDNGFVQNILSQGGSQNKGYQSNSFLSGNFNQYVGDNRHNYPAVPFFQGGFSQGVSASDSFPQPFMPNLDTGVGNMSSNVIQQGLSTTNINTPPPPSEKPQSFTQSEADLIKEMLSTSQIHDVFKEQPGSSKSTPREKEKQIKVKGEKDSAEKKKGEPKAKREKRPENWQRNLKKKLKTEGKAYVNAKGKLIPEKKMLPVDCSKCKQKCTEKITEDTRGKIFEWFWKLGSYTAQKEFVVSRVTEVQTKTSKRRHVHRLFSFEINGKYISVCKPFFSRTLGVGDSYIYKAFEQKKRDLFVQDGRGKHAPVNKTSELQVDLVHHHLEAYLSGYPTHKALPKNVHYVKWYDEYLQGCHDCDQKPVSKHIYRKIFKEFTLKYPKSPEKKKSDKKLSMVDHSEHPASQIGLYRK